MSVVAGALYAWPEEYWAEEAALVLEQERETEKSSVQTVVTSGLQGAKPIAEVGDTRGDRAACPCAP